jgi:hypothetical protein
MHSAMCELGLGLHNATRILSRSATHVQRVPVPCQVVLRKQATGRLRVQSPAAPSIIGPASRCRVEAAASAGAGWRRIQSWSRCTSNAQALLLVVAQRLALVMTGFEPVLLCDSRSMCR